MRWLSVFLVAFFLWGGALRAHAAEVPTSWPRDWPRTNFAKTSIDYAEILSGGPKKDGIPAIDAPKFVPLSEAAALSDTEVSDTEPVIALEIKGDARAYPLGILTWHEIVNDTVGGVPVTVTYCPLCNAGIVFDRRIQGRVLDFGTTGKLRNSDLVMYDRQTESWWQQFSGEAIVGEMTGTELTMRPARIESFGRFRAQHPNGKLLVPNDPDRRRYGENPYVGYDSAAAPFLYRGDLPENLPPMMRVVVVEGRAWTLPLLRERGVIDAGDLQITWEAGQNSALDTAKIAQGRDVGSVAVTQNGEAVVHHVTFAFVFHAFHPDGKIFSEWN
ncbi:MAG: DUF3179 domain-containing protein [Magnetospiraceae bacterium]